MSDITIFSRKTKVKRHKVDVSGFLLFVLLLLNLTVIYFIYRYLDKNIMQQLQRNSYLQKQVSFVKNNNEHKQQLTLDTDLIKHKINHIKKLKRQTKKQALLLFELAKAIPATSILQIIKQQGSYIFIEGESSSKSDIALILINLKQSSLFAQTVLLRIEQKDDSQNIHDRGTNSQTQLTVNYVITPVHFAIKITMKE